MKRFLKVLLAVSAMAMMFAMPASAAVKTSVKVLNVGKSYTISSTSKVTSSKKSVATAKKKSGSKYKITAKKKGVSTLKVYNKKGKQTKKIYLLATNSNSFKYSTSTINLAKGATKTVKGTSNISGMTVKYSSSNSNVATVNSSGKITAKKAGSATISAKFYYKGIKAKTVSKKVNVYSSSYDTSAISLTEGKTKTVSASVSSNCTAKYSSSNTNVAKVSSAGKITAVKKGTATITCKVYLGSTNVKTYTKKVTVNAASSSSSTSSSTSSGASSSSGSSSSGSSSSSSSSGSSSSSSSDAGFIYHLSTTKMSIQGGRTYTLSVYCEKASDIVTYKFNNDCIDITNTKTTTKADSTNNNATAYLTQLDITGRKEGVSILSIYVNGSKIGEFTATVTSTDSNYYTYLDWKAEIKSKVWYSGMTDLQKLKSFGDYVCSICYYQTSGSMYSLSGSGYGDCISFAALMVDLATDLGYNAEMICPYYDLNITGYSPTHYMAKVYNLNGADYYYFDISGSSLECIYAYRNGKLEDVTYDKKW